jgi:hypothetical protein
LKIKQETKFGSINKGEIRRKLANSDKMEISKELFPLERGFK